MEEAPVAGPLLHGSSPAGQLRECVAAGANVTSTCEELSFPFGAASAHATALDAQARDAGVTVLGTGGGQPRQA